MQLKSLEIGAALTVKRSGQRSRAGRQVWKGLSCGEIGWDGGVDRGGEEGQGLSRLGRRPWGGRGRGKPGVREHRCEKQSGRSAGLGPAGPGRKK